jgi:predicted nuclease of predicted toxin-antitoxin system
MDETPKLFIAIYTDAHVSKQLTKDLRERGYEAANASDLGHADWKDEQHLTYAAEHKMAVLTFDTRFEQLGREWATRERDFWGIIISPEMGERDYGRLLKTTLNLLDVMTADELRGAVVHLQQFEK